MNHNASTLAPHAFASSLARPVRELETPKLCAPADARAVFEKTSIYPVTLASASVYADAIDLFVQWLDIAQFRFEPARQPWLPIGRTGPLLVLGHYDVAHPCPLPQGWFQPVRLRRTDYERHLGLCTPLIEHAAAPNWADGELVTPRRVFPGRDARLIRPTTVRAALRFLIEYFPHRRSDLQRVHDVLLNSDELAFEDLVPGYACACWLLVGRGAVVDPTVVVTAQLTAQRLPAELAVRLRAISEDENNLWVATDRLPLPQVEDTLLNELGDGWHVHFLRCIPLRSGEDVPEGTASWEPGAQSATTTGTDDRAVIRIENTRSKKGNEAASDPGVIRLSTREVRELEVYNARRPDRDPLKVFLKELSAGIRHGATDLHIEVGLDSYRVRARIDGYLEEWLHMPLDFGKMVVGAAKEQFSMPPERWMPQDGACTVYHGSDVVNLRVAAYPVRGTGQKLAIRYLPRRGQVPPLDQLMPARAAALMRRAITRPYGLILLCGPTGSGKTTTTFSALAEINRSEVNITTMEDPVEYEMDGVNQAELDKVRGVDWDALLSGFLRQDPDIGMVGEIRDRQTAETAIRLTLTGHIVFATLHTMSCAHTVERLVDTGVNPQMLADSATLIVSQRLIRRLCKRCKDAGCRPITAVEKSLFTQHGIAPPDVVFDAAATECRECRNTGFKGQVGVFEMLPVANDVARMIAEKHSVRAIEDWMDRNHLPRVYDAALSLVAAGETSFSEANQWQAVWDELPIADAPHSAQTS